MDNSYKHHNNIFYLSIVTLWVFRFYCELNFTVQVYIVLKLIFHAPSLIENLNTILYYILYKNAGKKNLPQNVTEVKEIFWL